MNLSITARIHVNSKRKYEQTFIPRVAKDASSRDKEAN